MILWILIHVSALTLHLAFLRNWRRELRELDDRRREYNAVEDLRHKEFMSALTWYRSAKLGWSDKRGKA